MKHTPTPWSKPKKCSCGHDCCNSYYLSNQDSVGFSKEDAEHIVKCVNAFDELMEFVKDYKNADRRAKELLKKYGE